MLAGEIAYKVVGAGRKHKKLAELFEVFIGKAEYAEQEKTLVEAGANLSVNENRLIIQCLGTEVHIGYSLCYIEGHERGKLTATHEYSERNGDRKSIFIKTYYFDGGGNIFNDEARETDWDMSSSTDLSYLVTDVLGAFLDTDYFKP